MKSGSRKGLFVLIMAAMITILVFLVLGYREQLEQAVSYEEFSTEEKEGIYEITSVEDYLKFSETVADGNKYEWCEIRLNADLDFLGVENVMPIGLQSEELIEFKGTFNGNGHTIRNLQIINPNGVSGMFANLGGIIKNLRLENCDFEGNICGALTAQSMVNAVVLNCDLDARTTGETHGTVAGKFFGYIFNCVVTGEQIVGELHTGWVEQCYYKNEGEYILADGEEERIDAETAKSNLNANLSRSSAFHDDYELCLWDVDGELRLSTDKAEVLETLSAKLYIHNEKIELKGYYSQNDNHWCIAIPAGYEAEAMTMTAVTNYGNKEIFSRAASENEILYTQGEYQYLIDFLTADNIDTLYIQLSKNKDLEYIHKNKREEIPGMIMILDQSGNIEKEVLKGIYGHGNDSWAAQKKSYNLKLENRVDFLGMGENEDFVLLAGYRDDSLMSYVTTTSLIKELGFDYAPEFRLVNLYVEGEYAGVYFLAEKIEIDENRIEISNLYEETKKLNSNYLDGFEFQEWKDEKSSAERYFYDVDKQPEDITGGYLLEIDVEDYDLKESRFVTERGVKVTMKRARCSSKEQVNYMADYWQEFEDALYSKTGKNSYGKHYSEYIDMDSFVMQWLLYELVQEGSMSSSIYFYKESDVTGDGLLHACFPWDMEHSYLLYGPMEQMWLKDSETLSAYWSSFWIHEDFRNAVNEAWKSKFVPAIDWVILEESFESESGVKNLRWYEDHIGDMSVMETSCYRKMNPYNRCQSIREFLKTRKDTLSVLLAE